MCDLKKKRQISDDLTKILWQTAANTTRSNPQQNRQRRKVSSGKQKNKIKSNRVDGARNEISKIEMKQIHHLQEKQRE